LLGTYANPVVCFWFSSTVVIQEGFGLMAILKSRGVYVFEHFYDKWNPNSWD